MTSEEIEISELELKETLSGDDLFAVETSVKTFATTLTRLKNWLAGFFVGLSEDQIVYGNKTFNKSPLLPNLAISDNSQKGVNSAYIKNILNNLYPIGSIYITTNETCPLSLINGSTWTKVGTGRVLQGSDSNHAAGTTIEAGLPNITGSFQSDDFHQPTGAFYFGNSVSGNAGGGSDRVVNFEASRSNSIYGNSTTVQPPAYVVNIFRRTA